MTAPDIAALLRAATARLAAASDSPRLDAELLLAHALERPRSHLAAWPERVPDAAAQARYEALIRRRADGTPVAHLCGQREFWSLELEVAPSTLIPRPDTETLVELALQRIPAGARWRIADLGTGTGAIALALASERPAAQLIGVERDPDALALAARNVARLGTGNVELRAGSWCAPLSGERLEMIVSNPPYLAADDPHLTQGDLRHEPHSALVADQAGLADLATIIDQARDHLRPPGWLLLEHGHTQGPAVARLLAAAGYADIRIERDLAGRDRVACARWPDPSSN